MQISKRYDTKQKNRKKEKQKTEKIIKEQKYH